MKNPLVLDDVPLLDLKIEKSQERIQPKVVRNEVKQDEKMLKETCGDAPEARKNKYIIKDRRILNAVERYDPDTMELVVYFDSLRNVMWIINITVLFKFI